MRVLKLLPLALLLTACASIPAPDCDPPEGIRAFEAPHIGEQWINYVWMELPVPDASASLRSDSPRHVTGRLFVASAEPVGAIVPAMVDLICADGPVEYAPEPVEFDIDEGGTLRTSYGWKNCAACSECYMQWTFRLDLEGQLQGDALDAELVLNETFHSGPMKITTVRMEQVNACLEPRLTCQAGGECGEIRNAPITQ